jgi:hypothetical protein
VKRKRRPGCHCAGQYLPSVRVPSARVPEYDIDRPGWPRTLATFLCIMAGLGAFYLSAIIWAAHRAPIIP